MSDPLQIDIASITTKQSDVIEHFNNLAAENDALKRELEITKQLITKGVDIHSYILGFKDCRESMQFEIELLKQSLRNPNTEDE